MGTLCSGELTKVADNILFFFSEKIRLDISYGLSANFSRHFDFFSIFLCPATKKVVGYYVIPSEILSVCPSICPSVPQRPHHSSARNSSYSFRSILFKLDRRFYDGLKICILFLQNPEIIFYHIFCIFNLDSFRALILQKCIGSMYFLPATPPTVLGRSFSNFTGAFRMV